MNRLLSTALITIAIVGLAACSAGSAGRTVEPSIDPDALTIAADDLEFSTSRLSAPADEPFQIAFDNQERAPHNVAIYRDESASEMMFGSEPFSGPAVVTYDGRRSRRAPTSSVATSIPTWPASSASADPDDGGDVEWPRPDDLSATRTRGWGSRLEPPSPT